MAVIFHGASYSGLSGDTKPSSNLTAGDLFVETNTDKIFQWNGSAWDAITVADSAITLAKMAVNSVDSDQYVDGSIDLAHMSDNSVDSAQYVDGSIDLAHMSDNSVDSAQYVDGSIDLAHMSVNSIDSDQYVDGSIDLAHMSDNSIDSDQYVDGSIDTIHIGDNQVTGTKIAMSSDARGDVLVYDGTNYIRLAADNGKFLRSNGTGSNPSWETAGGDLSFGGDTFGANKVIGSNDNYDLAFETNGTTRVTIANNGAIGVHATSPTLTNALQIGDGECPAIIQHFSSDYVMYGSNAYYDGSYKCLKAAERPMAIRFMGQDSGLCGFNISIGDEVSSAGGTVSQTFDAIWDSSNASTSSGTVFHIAGKGAYGGNVGIGTHQPIFRVEIEDERGDYILGLKGSKSDAFNGLKIEYAGASVAQTGRFISAKNGNADEDKFAVENNGDVMSRTNSYGAFSDERLKTNIVAPTSSLTELLKLKIKEFELVATPGETQRGIIAQEFIADEVNIPSFVGTMIDQHVNNTGQAEEVETYTAVYPRLIPWLVQAVQELKAEIEALKS